MLRVKIQHKYRLQCTQCGHVTPNFWTWFEQGQQCPACSSRHSEVWYNRRYQRLARIIKRKPDSFWHYFPFLPLLRRRHIISRNEGAVPVERWSFLEAFAKEKYGLEIKVHVYRNDLNGGTGTFKDPAASMAASLFNELGIKQYCIASTGNSATAYAKYLSMAKVNCSVFMPEDAIKTSEATISSYGQQVFRVKGDYAKAKEIATGYAKIHGIPMSTGNIDPIRVEAKKTMVFEWLRQMEQFPDVYIQAVSGGTGPIAIDKGIREISHLYPELKNPRFLLVQSDGCDPMVQAWEQAEANGFPEGFEKEYPVIDNPATEVPTLATGNPASYPLIAKLVKQSGGTFLRMREEKLVAVGKLTAYEQKVIPGPASAVCLAGFFIALQKNLIRDGETVLINIGEGPNRAPLFLEQMIYTSHNVSNVEECAPHSMEDYRRELWNEVLE
ncbi:MAG: pyridoxal-phosphate dependent enzyme [Proteiniphilum sp.]|nr:pyridoxal-phosphate dependent enzyme [Proteiniphilum sp.]MDD3979960.1 pyridoxal-phosphate dependent enzyme [Proteiniphilum sp.]